MYKENLEILEKAIKSSIKSSAPRIPNDIKYWQKKGKTGKDVCIFLHDDLDGLTSAILMKNYLLSKGFTIKKIGIINYQDSWNAFELDPKLINIALDFSEDAEGLDIYIDHHSQFTDETRINKTSIKTVTDSAAEGIALQLGIPLSKETLDWISMIDSAKYSEYNVDIKNILEFDLNKIKNLPNAKMNFAASFNQLIKRSDYKTFIEIVNASEYPSIYNIFRLFKLFYPQNNPNWKNGEEPDFLTDAHDRLGKMYNKTRGDLCDVFGKPNKGFERTANGIIKKRYMDQKDFWKDFSESKPDPDVWSYTIGEEDYVDPNDSKNFRWQVKTGVYQLIGNLMYIPSGTWANSLRAKAIFCQDQKLGVVPNDSKLNFVLIQYGNSLQLADLTNRIDKMKDEDLPRLKNGYIIRHLGDYMTTLVNNFKEHLQYTDKRIMSGGHCGIGTISNIFEKCEMPKYEGIKYLDMLKNKIISDFSGIKWLISMVWNENETQYDYLEKTINKKVLGINEIRSENDAIEENKERSLISHIIANKNKYTSEELQNFIFNQPTTKGIYDIWLKTNFNELNYLSISMLDELYFKLEQPKRIENTDIFKNIVETFKLRNIYDYDNSDKRKYQRKELKRIFRLIFNLSK